MSPTNTRQPSSQNRVCGQSHLVQRVRLRGPVNRIVQLFKK